MSMAVSLINWETSQAVQNSMAWQLPMENFFKDKVSTPACPK
jgi:hypothetical protein